MTTYFQNFVTIAEAGGWMVGVEDIADDLGEGQLAVAVDHDAQRHVAVLAEVDTGLITYVSMRWKDDAGGGMLHRDLNTDDFAALFGTAIGWLMQPMWDNKARELSPERMARINRTVVWCPTCMQPAEKCDCNRPVEPEPWDAEVVFEPQEVVQPNEMEPCENPW